MKNDLIIATLFVIGTIFLLISHVSTNNLDFSRYNSGWNGTSEFFEIPDRHSTTDISNLSSLTGRSNSTLLVIAPENQFSANDLVNYRSFLKDGNTIFLADDYGTGNQLLKGINSSIRMIPGTLSSVDRAYNNSTTIVTYPVDTDLWTRNISSLVLDRAVALEGGEPLMKTTLMSWIDADDNGQITKKEMLGKYTVLTHETIETGELIVLSDPSVFINAMNNPGEKWSNQEFIRNVVETNKNLLLDQVHSKTSDTIGLSQTMQQVRANPMFSLFLIGFLFLSIAIILSRKSDK